MVSNARARLDSFTENGKAALQASPDYFLWWYTVKSVGLGIVGAYAAYLLGKASAKR